MNQPQFREEAEADALLRRFPYSVIYVLEGETVLVLAVLHGSRNPDDLRKRLDG